uniref:Uncharacterized protein n=2 Tax=Auxenochlorella protothecoides TaxID=3075 RepID=A0A1D1ZP90_AUXPR
MASEPEEASTPAGIPGDSQEEDGSRTSSPPLPVGSDDAVGSPAQPPERESTEEAGPGGPDFVPPLPAGDGPGQALILHGTGASSDSDSDDYSTSSDEEPDESQLPPGPIDPSRCSATGPGFSGGSSGMPVKMVITAKDSAGRRIRDGGAYVLVTLDKPAPTGSVVVARAEVTDHGDGTYTALYTCPSKGSYQLTVELNGQPLGQFPFPIYFSAPDLQAAAKALEAASAAAAAAGSGAAAVNGPVPTAPGPVSAAQLSAGAVGFGVAQPIPGAAPPTLGAQAALSGVPFPATDLERLSRTVLVGAPCSLPSGEALAAAFLRAGAVASVQLAGPGAAFAWVEFAAAASVPAALAMDGAAVPPLVPGGEPVTLRVEAGAAARAAAEALVSGQAALDPAKAAALQQAQRFAALSAQQAALAESVLAARAMRAGAVAGPEAQRHAAVAAAAALARRLAGGATVPAGNGAAGTVAGDGGRRDDGSRERRREEGRERRRSGSRDRKRSGSGERRRAEGRERRRSRSPHRRSGSWDRKRRDRWVTMREERATVAESILAHPG